MCSYKGVIELYNPYIMMEGHSEILCAIIASMEQSYTENDLIQFIYKDMEAVEYCELLFSLDGNPELNESYEELLNAKKELPAVSFMPTQESMNMILAYSKL